MPRQRMTIAAGHDGERILCLRLSGLGDLVHALNALALLRRERPEAHIAWALEDRFAGLLTGHPHVDELIVVPRGPWAAALKRPWRWPGLAPALSRFASGLRERRFDASVDFQSSLKSAWLVRAARAGLRIGFDRPVSRELNRLVQNSLVRVPAAGVHRIERDLALLAPLGIPTCYAEPLVPVSPQDAEAADRLLSGTLAGGPLVVIHPGTSKAAAFKRWLPDRYAAVADELVTKRTADVLVTCGPEDRDLAEEVLRLMRCRGALAPRTQNLQQFARLVSRAALFVGSDTGAMHIASALGAPVVALFGPKDPVQTGPYCSRSMVVTGQAGCRPCNRRKCSHVRCMTSISAESVLDAAIQVLDGAGECRARQGPIKAPFTAGLGFGQWRGRVATCYGSPEFLEWLRSLTASAGAGAASAPSVAGLPGRLVVRTGATEALGRRRARAEWDAALGDWPGPPAARPAPFPVCFMEKRGGQEADWVLVSEEERAPRPARHEKEERRHV